MLASSAIIEINNRYNEAQLHQRMGKTACIEIGKLGQKYLVYIVGQNTIELGLRDKTGVLTALDENAVRLLQAGYSQQQKLYNMIDIAFNLNSHSKLTAQQ